MRKPPIRHTVSGHYRQGKWVGSFKRGRGRIHRNAGRRVVGAQDNYFGYISKRLGGEAKSGVLTGSGHIRNWKVNGKVTTGISYDLRNNTLLFTAGEAFHEAAEDAHGYENTRWNESRITRISKLPDEEVLRIYTYSGAGTDGYPNISATVLSKLLAEGLIDDGDKVVVYFDKKYEPHIEGTVWRAREAIGVLRDAWRMSK